MLAAIVLGIAVRDLFRQLHYTVVSAHPDRGSDATVRRKKKKKKEEKTIERVAYAALSPRTDLDVLC